MKLTTLIKKKLRLTSFSEEARTKTEKIIKITKVVAYIDYKGKGKSKQGKIAVLLSDKKINVYYAEVWYQNLLMSLKMIDNLAGIQYFFSSVKTDGGVIVELEMYDKIKQKIITELI